RRRAGWRGRCWSTGATSSIPRRFGRPASNTRAWVARARMTGAVRRSPVARVQSTLRDAPDRRISASSLARVRSTPGSMRPRSAWAHASRGLRMQAIVLVGGEGTRLRPLTSTVPKPALTLVDRPFLAYMIEWLGAHGVTEVVLACGFLPGILQEALGEGEHGGVRLTYVTEPDRRGTAGAIRFAADALGDDLDDRFLALNGDVLTDLDLTALMDAHRERGARATIALYPVEDSAAYGLVGVDGEGRVTEFVEKTG